MPRAGTNPLKWDDGNAVHLPERITVTMIVYIPALIGYWEQALDVVKTSLKSLRQSTTIPFDLMILDNASCIEVQDYLVELRRQNVIQFLMLSDANLGKVGAWNLLFPAAPGEIVAYADSDCLFLPGWLENSLTVLKAFPKAGMITAQPARWSKRYDAFNVATLSDLERDPAVKLERGDFIPEHYLEAFSRGLGEAEEKRRIREGREDIRISKGDVVAYVGGSHFEFLAPKATLCKVLPISAVGLVGVERRFDAKVNEIGHWRLTTVDYLVHHLGNRLLKAENGYDGLTWVPIEDYFDPQKIAEPRQTAPRRANEFSDRMIRYVVRRRFAKRFLRRVNLLTHKLLIHERG